MMPGRPDADAEQFETMIRHTRAQLQQAAGLQLSARREVDQAIVDVTVENRTGHKFPTGHPYRRAWLHVRGRDAGGRTLFESGVVDKAGALPGLADGFTPHRDRITAPNQTQVYQSVMGDQEGSPTWSLLRGARYLKDNRIPPRGFRATGPQAASIAVRGEATTDGNFHADEGGQDTVHYCVPLLEPEGRLRVEVELFYQSVPPEAVERLLHSNGPEANSFARMFTRQPNRPEVVARAQKEF